MGDDYPICLMYSTYDINDKYKMDIFSHKFYVQVPHFEMSLIDTF